MGYFEWGPWCLRSVVLHFVHMGAAVLYHGHRASSILRPEGRSRVTPLCLKSKRGMSVILCLGMWQSPSLCFDCEICIVWGNAYKVRGLDLDFILINDIRWPSELIKDIKGVLYLCLCWCLVIYLRSEPGKKNYLMKKTLPYSRAHVPSMSKHNSLRQRVMVKFREEGVHAVENKEYVCVPSKK